MGCCCCCLEEVSAAWGEGGAAAARPRKAQMQMTGSSDGPLLFQGPSSFVVAVCCVTASVASESFLPESEPKGSFVGPLVVVVVVVSLGEGGCSFSAPRLLSYCLDVFLVAFAFAFESPQVSV